MLVSSFLQEPIRLCSFIAYRDPSRVESYDEPSDLKMFGEFCSTWFAGEDRPGVHTLYFCPPEWVWGRGARRFLPD